MIRVIRDKKKDFTFLQNPFNLLSVKFVIIRVIRDLYCSSIWNVIGCLR